MFALQDFPSPTGQQITIKAKLYYMRITNEDRSV